MRYLLLIVLPTVFAFPLADQQALAADDAAPARYDGKSVPQWIQQLGDKNDEVRRRQAAYALGRIGPEARSAVPALIVAVSLAERSQRVSWYAVEALGHIGPAASTAVPTIIACIKDESYDSTFNRTAARALGRIGPEAGGATALLTEGLGSDDLHYRAAVALALWKIDRNQAGLAALIDLLQQDARQEVGSGAYQACTAFLEIGPETSEVIEALIGALAHRDEDVRRAAAEVLGSWGEAVMSPLAKALLESNSVDRRPAIVALGSVIDELRDDVLYRGDVDQARFRAAAEQLETVTVGALRRQLADPHPEVRQSAAEALAKAGPFGVEALLLSLREGDEPTRQSAAEGLIRMERYLPNGDAAGRNLERVKSNLIGPLVEALGDDNRAVRAAAVRAFAQLSIDRDAEAAVPRLTEALRDDDPNVRRYANLALSRISQSP